MEQGEKWMPKIQAVVKEIIAQPISKLRPNILWKGFPGYRELFSSARSRGREEWEIASELYDKSGGDPNVSVGTFQEWCEEHREEIDSRLPPLNLPLISPQEERHWNTLKTILKQPILSVLMNGTSEQAETALVMLVGVLQTRSDYFLEETASTRPFGKEILQISGLPAAVVIATLYGFIHDDVCVTWMSNGIMKGISKSTWEQYKRIFQVPISPNDVWDALQQKHFANPSKVIKTIREIKGTRVEPYLCGSVRNFLRNTFREDKQLKPYYQEDEDHPFDPFPSRTTNDHKTFIIFDRAEQLVQKSVKRSDKRTHMLELLHCYYERDYTQIDLAQKLGVSDRTIRTLEKDLKQILIPLRSSLRNSQ